MYNGRGEDENRAERSNKHFNKDHICDQFCLLPHVNERALPVLSHLALRDARGRIRGDGVFSSEPLLSQRQRYWPMLNR